MLEKMKAAKIPLEEIRSNPKKLVSIQATVDSFVAQDQELKYLAQKSFISYLRSVFLQRDKEVFDVTALPADEYAKSLGLPLSPNISFSKTRKQDKNLSRAALADVSDSEDDKLISKEDGSEQEGEEGEAEGGDSNADQDAPKEHKSAEKKLVPKTKKEKVEKKEKSKLDKLFARRSTGLERFEKLRTKDEAQDDAGEDSSEELLVKKQGGNHAHDEEAGDPQAQQKKIKQRPNGAAPSEDEKQKRAQYVARLQQSLQNADQRDKAVAREKRIAKRLALKQRAKEAALAERGMTDGGGGAYLAAENGEQDDSAASSADEEEGRGGYRPGDRAAEDEPSGEEGDESDDGDKNEDEQEALLAQERPKRKDSSSAGARKPAISLPQSLEEQEELALSILKKRKLH
jgi:ATP-dependent RNA helicase DDX10/DBP4